MRHGVDVETPPPSRLVTNLLCHRYWRARHRGHRRTASGSSDTSLRIWDLADTSGLEEPVRTLSGHTQLVRAVRFDVERDLLVSGSYDGRIGVWRFSTGAAVSACSRAGRGRAKAAQRRRLTRVTDTGLHPAIHVASHQKTPPPGDLLYWISTPIEPPETSLAYVYRVQFNDCVLMAERC